MNGKLLTSKLYWLIVAAFVALSVACSPTEAQSNDNQDEPAPVSGNLLGDLTGNDWDLVDLVGQAPMPGSKATITFTGVGLNGSTGCNSYFGGYTLDGDKLTISEVGQTEMWCEDLMDQEQAFLSALMAVESVSVSEQQLSLHTAAGDLVFEAATPLTLEGTEWILNGIMVENGFVSTYLDDAITAEFKEGQMEGSAGCNGYFASFEVERTALSLGPVGTTMMACDDEVSQRESDFLSALAGVARFEIQREVLTLMDDEGNVLIKFRG